MAGSVRPTELQGAAAHRLTADIGFRLVADFGNWRANVGGGRNLTLNDSTCECPLYLATCPSMTEGRVDKSIACGRCRPTTGPARSELALSTPFRHWRRRGPDVHAFAITDITARFRTVGDKYSSRGLRAPRVRGQDLDSQSPA